LTLVSLLDLSGTLAGAALRPLAAGVTLGMRAERELRGALARRADAAALAGLDALLTSALATEAIDRVLASQLAAQTVDRVLASELAAEAVDRVLASELATEAIDRVLASELAAEAVDRVLASELARRAVGGALAGPLVDEVVARLLQADALWLLVDEIARSPSVTEAITHQSVGFVDEVADGVRARSRKVDNRLESRVRRALGREQRAQPAEDGTGA
jgi:hypothetical protein